MLLLVLLGSPVEGQRFAVRTFTEGDGLRSSTVHDLAQDDQGRIWFLTRAGAVRYDGSQWVTPDVRPTHRFFGYTFLEVDATGGAWLAGGAVHLPLLRIGGPTGSLAEAATPVHGPADAEERTSLATVTEGGATTVVLGTRGAGLHLLQGKRWLTLGANEGLPDLEVRALESAGERLFVATAGGVAILADGRIDPSLNDLLPPERRNVRALAWDAGSDALWLVSPTYVGRIQEGRFQVLADGLSIPRVADRLHLVAEPDGRGGLYFGSATRLLHLDGRSGEVIGLGRKNGLAAEGANDLELDRELNLWVATPRGVSRIPSLRFANWDASQGLLEDEVSAVVERVPGELVFGHNAGLSFLRRGEVVRTLPLVREDLQGVPLGRVMDLAAGPDGTLWVAGGHLGLARIATGGAVHWIGGGAEIDDRIDSVRVDPRGRVLLGTGTGLAEAVGDAIVPLTPPGLGRPGIRRITLSPEGTVYLATPGEGLYVRPPGGSWNNARGRVEMANDLFTVLEDASGRVWVGSAAGLLVLEDGALVRPPSAALSVKRPVYALVEDPEGRLWIGTDSGFYRWDGRALIHFTVVDGLPGNEANRAASLVDTAGRLWLGTDGGVSHVRNRADHAVLPPPRARLLGIEVDGRRYPPDRPLDLGHGQNRLAFLFGAVSFRDERIEYRTRLHGYEREWTVDKGPARIESRYSALPPGTYRFELQARSDRSDWSPAVITAPMTIARPFWLQAWFLGSVALGLMALGYSARRFLVQRQRAQILEREVSLRTAELAASRASIEAQREHLSRTLESVADGLAAVDSERRVVLWNRSAEEITGWPSEEAVGQPLDRVMRLSTDAGAAGRGFEDVLGAILERGERARVPGVYGLTASSGERRIVEVTGAPTGGASTPGGAVIAFRDVTERRRLEEELIKAQKLESLGVLAAGIAHDFNNLLTVILGNVSLIQSSRSLAEEDLQCLEQAQRALGRAQELSRRLLIFSHGGTPVTGAVSVVRLVRECAEFNCRGSNVRCHLELGEDLWPAEADEGQLCQVVNNLLINALQAMPEGGDVTVWADNRELQAGGETGLPAGRYVHLHVADQGEGIAPEDLPRIFDPFFTTKERGSGLGLTTVYSIVRQHGGAVRVESEPGEGTRFEVFLPASRSLPKRIPAPVSAAPRGTGRILVMDDQPAVRKVLETMLAHLGYRTVGAGDGEEAVDAYRAALERDDPFDLVILDLTVPGGMGGRETLRELLRLDPGVRAVASSGYAEDPVFSGGGDNGFAAALPKPYTLPNLNDVLHEVLRPDRTRRRATA